MRQRNVDLDLLHPRNYNRSRTTDTRLEAKLDRLIQSCTQTQNMIPLVPRADPSAYLDNCTDATQDAPEGGNDPMAYKREWVNLGTDENGMPKRIQISGRTQDERNDEIVKAYVQSGRIREFITIDDMAKLGLTYGDVDKAAVETTQQPKTDFCDYAWRCYRTYKEPRIAETSKSRETSALNVLCRFFNGWKLEDIGVADVQAWMFARAEDGMSETTIRDQKKALAWIFKNAVEDKLVTENPATSSRLQMCGCETEGTASLSEAEYRRLVALIPTLTDPREQLLLALFLLTGMRRSEVLGLKWEDIDFDEKWIHVQRARVCPNGVFRDKCTKSKAGNRFIPIHDILLDCLAKHRQEGGYVIAAKDGRPFETDNAYSSFYDGLMAKVGLKSVSALVFRTTYASMMASTSIPPKQLQAIMGHSKINVTMDVYAKVDKLQLGRARNALQEVLNGKSA